MIEITVQDAKEAIIQKKNVVYDNVRYKVAALIYRYYRKKWIVSAELLDKNKHSIIIARIDKIKLSEDEQI